MNEDIKRKGFLILNILRDSDVPLTSTKISEKLSDLGHNMSERTVRFYLKRLEGEGLSSRNGRKGHKITDKGLRELESWRVIEKVGFLSSKIDQIAYRMNFDINTLGGEVVVNVTIVEPREFAKKIPFIERVYEEGFTMGRLVAYLRPGETIGHISIPHGAIGVCTVCSITLNGVLLKYGIPTISRFGGLLELVDKKPLRFVEIIMYEGTSIDPLEIFIRSGMTDYLGAINTGNGRIGASFREFPADSRSRVKQIAERLEKIGLGGLIKMGLPGQSLLEIPVNEGRVGAIVVGGLNPMSILEETGVKAYSRALAGLLDFSRLFSYKEMEERIKDYL